MLFTASWVSVDCQSLLKAFGCKTDTVVVIVNENENDMSNNLNHITDKQQAAELLMNNQITVLPCFVANASVGDAIVTKYLENSDLLAGEVSTASESFTKAVEAYNNFDLDNATKWYVNGHGYLIANF